MQCEPVGSCSVVPVSRMNAARVVNAIKGIFFTYNYGPWVLFAEVRVKRKVKPIFLLNFRGFAIP